MNTEDSRLEPDYSHVHLQWFADENEDGGDGENEETSDGEKDVDEEIAELKKSLKALQKESSGKDRKISEYQKQLEQLKDRKGKETERKRIDLSDMSAEQIRREFERQREELENQFQKELEEERTKNKDNQYSQLVYQIASEIDGLDPIVIKAMLGPREPDEDKIRDRMTAFQKQLNTLVEKNRVVFGNIDKTTHKPQSGDIATSRAPTEREWEKMSETQRRNWAKGATKEQRDKVMWRN